MREAAPPRLSCVRILRSWLMRTKWALQSLGGLLYLLSISNVRHKVRPGNGGYLLVETNKLGDVVLACRLAERLFEGDPSASVTIAARTQYCDLIRALEPRAKTVGLPSSGGLAVLRHARGALRELEVHTAINCAPERSVLSDLLVFCARASNVAGFRGTGLFLRTGVRRCFDHRYSHLVESTTGHVTAHQDALLKVLVDLPAPLRRPMRRSIPHGGRLRVALMPRTSTMLKEWPLARFAELVHSFSPAAVSWIVFGAEHERAVLEAWSAQWHLGVEIAPAADGLAQLSGIVRTCHLAVGNDTGLMHLAEYLRIPTVVIMAGGEPGRFFPYPHGDSFTVAHEVPCAGCRWLCRYEEPWCIDRIAPSEVVEIVRRAIRDQAGEGREV